MDKSLTWNILIATIGQRENRFKRLLNLLIPQISPHNGRVRITALWNNGERPLAEVRQDLLESASLEYVSFIDDDDIIPEYYVDEVSSKLDGVHYIGWRMQCIMNGRNLKPTFHSLRYDHWWDDKYGYYRDVSHLNPIRTDLAKLADFRKTQPPEDVSWADQLRGKLKTEHYIDKIMYYYHSSTVDSTWRHGRVKPGNYHRPIIGCPYFSYHPNSSEEA